jgi:hypothetical protein
VQLSLEGLRQALYAWLSERGPGVLLVCDSKRDVPQLQTLLSTGLPSNATVCVLGYWGTLKRRFLNRGRRIHRRLGLRVHHALDDARVNRRMLAR